MRNEGAVEANTLQCFWCRQVCYSVKSTLRRGVRKWYAFWSECQATSYSCRRDLAFFAWYPTSFHMFFDFLNFKRVKWRTSGGFFDRRSRDIVDHSCSMCSLIVSGYGVTRKTLCFPRWTAQWLSKFRDQVVHMKPKAIMHINGFYFPCPTIQQMLVSAGACCWMCPCAMWTWCSSDIAVCGFGYHTALTSSARSVTRRRRMDCLPRRRSTRTQPPWLRTHWTQHLPEQLVPAAHLCLRRPCRHAPTWLPNCVSSCKNCMLAGVSYTHQQSLRPPPSGIGAPTRRSPRLCPSSDKSYYSRRDSEAWDFCPRMLVFVTERERAREREKVRESDREK